MSHARPAIIVSKLADTMSRIGDRATALAAATEQLTAASGQIATSADHTSPAGHRDHGGRHGDR